MFFRSSKTGGQSSSSKAPSLEGANANQNTNTNTIATNSENAAIQSPPILPPRRRSSMLPSQYRGKIVVMGR